LDPGDYAPVLAVSLMQHSVEISFSACTKRVLPVLQDLFVKEMSPEKDTMLNSFLQPLFDAAMKDSSDLEAVGDELQERVGPMIRQAYASSFSRLRQKRLSDLAKAKAEWKARDSLRKERQARQRAAREALMEAADALDAELFGMRKEKFLSKGVLDKDYVRKVEEDMYAELAEIEAPVRRLVAVHTGDPGGAAFGPHDLQTEQIEAVLAASRLPERSAWRRVGQELREVLSSLAVMREEAASLALHRHSSAASLKVAVLRCNAMLMRGEAKLVHFESSVRSAGAALDDRGAVPLRQVLEEWRETTTTAARDEALWRCLSAVPWSEDTLQAPRVRQEDMAELEAKGAVVSGLALSRFGDALKAALEGGRCALAVQQALRDDDLHALEESLCKAKERALGGLEAAEQRLQELLALQAVRSDLQMAALEAVKALDSQRFEQLLETARGNGIELPAEEEEQTRLDLARAVEEAEAALQEPLMAAMGNLHGAPALVGRLQKALEATRLPADNAWRVAAEAGLEAMEVAARVRRAAASAARASRGEPALDVEDETAPEPAALKELAEEVEEAEDTAEVLAALEEALAAGAPAVARLEAEGQRVGSARLGEAAPLRKALEEGEAALRGLKADEALRARLAAAPWNLQPLPLAEAAAGDLEELRQLADGATIGGLYRAAAALDAALAAGACAQELCEAMAAADREALAKRLREAEPMGFSGLEPARKQLAELEEVAAAAKKLHVRASSGRDDRWTDMSAESTNLIFLDLELTAGFYEFDVRPQILEAAIVVTDKELNEKGRGTWVVGDFTREELESLGDFHQAHFRDVEYFGGPFPPRMDLGGSGNGLFADVLASSLTLEEAEDAMLDLVRKHCPPGACPLSGYSVQCDREVLKVEMPRLYRYVSHQIVDVSSFLRMARLRCPEHVKQWDRRDSRYNHRALNDVEDSILALRWVQEEFFQPALRS